MSDPETPAIDETVETPTIDETVAIPLNDYKAKAEEFEGKYKALQKTLTEKDKDSNSRIKELESKLDAISKESDAIKKNTLLTELQNLNPKLAKTLKDADIATLTTSLKTAQIMNDDFPTMKEGKEEPESTNMRFDFVSKKWIPG